MPRGIALSDAGAALLHRRTEGWAAGLRLAVISLAGHPDPERFVAEFSGSDRTVAEAIRHTQAAGDWPDAARLLADHSFSLTLDGQAQTIQALVRAFPQGAAADDPELALVRAAERALSLAEPDRLVLPFAMTGAGELLEALPRHQTAHAALLTDVLDVVHGASLPANDQLASPPTEELSPSELRVLRYLPTNLSRPEIASELSVSVNTVNTHVRNIYAKLQARDRSSAVQRARELRLLSTGLTR